MKKINKTLDIPAVLIHQIGDTKYEIKGIITDINESANTCSMKFEGYDVQEGIPMDSVYLNEAFLDKVKDYTRKAWDAVKMVIKRVKGFLFPVNEDGEVDYSFANAPINMAIASTKGMLSPSIKFFPSNGMIEMAAQNGVKVDAGDLDNTMESDVKEIETYWKRVMKRYVKDEDSTISEAVKYVNENYYRPNKALKHLNETPVVTLHNPINGQYGQEVDAKELQSLLISNIVKQITPREDGSSSKEKPLLIWGAPGIGKTAIVKQAIDDIRDIYGIDLATEYLVLGQMFREDFVLPDTVTNIAGERGAIDVPKVWLPVYYPSPDPKKRAAQDAYYNSGLYKYTENDLIMDDGSTIEPKKFDGGVIFMDEFSRMNSTVGSIVMNIVNDKVYQNMVLASRWGFVLAANRAIDMLEPETASRWEPAKADRYISIMYVPKKSDWLEWARQKKAVGPKGEVRQNVDEMICSFIESVSDGVWYDALDLGSRDDDMNDDQRKTVRNKSDIEELETLLTDGSELGLDKTTWTPRDWSEKVSDSILGELKLIFMGKPELYSSIFVDGNISQPKLASALNELPDKMWNVWANRNKFLDPENNLSRIGLFTEWITHHITSSMGGEDTLPSKEWVKYNEWDSTFSDKVIASIWKDHNLGNKRLTMEDDKYFTNIVQYQTTETCKWKSKTLTITNVFKKILDNFPGGAANYTKLANEAFKNAYEDPTKFMPYDYLANHTMADVDKAVNELSEYFSFNLGSTKIYALREPGKFNIKDKKDAYIAQCLTMFTASDLPKMIANVMMYAMKITLQSNVDSVKEMVMKPLIHGMYKDLYTGTAPGMADHDQSMSAFVGNAALIKKLPYKLFTDAPETYTLANSIFGIAVLIYENAATMKKRAAATGGKL